MALFIILTTLFVATFLFTTYRSVCIDVRFVDIRFVDVRFVDVRLTDNDELISRAHHQLSCAKGIYRI
jgi:hypothetical protein